MEMRGAAAAAGRGSAAGNADSKNKSPREQHEMEHKTVKQRVKKRRKSSESPQKKLPRRGLGVAQLEQLRLQEHWKKMIKINQAHQPPFNFQDHHNGVLVPYSRFGPVNLGGLTNNVAFTSYGDQSIFSDQFQMDRMRIATQEPRFYSGNLHLYETSKELSSSQMMHWSSDQCYICKKKHFRSGKYPEISKNILVEERRDYHGRVIGLNPASFSLSGNIHKEVEVLANHRQEKSVGGNGLMGYDFFPHKAD